MAYLMLACALTTLPGLLGFVFPKKWVKKYMGIFLSIGIGCLLATVFLHIVPEMMEVSQNEAAKHSVEDYREYTLQAKNNPHVHCDHDHACDDPAHDHAAEGHVLRSMLQHRPRLALWSSYSPTETTDALLA